MEREPPSDRRFPNGPPLNGCAGCHRDFASLKAFDLHFEQDEGHVGCGDLIGWVQDKRGRWTTVKLAENAALIREHFSSGPTRRLERAGRAPSV